MPRSRTVGDVGQIAGIDVRGASMDEYAPARVSFVVDSVHLEGCVRRSQGLGERYGVGFGRALEAFCFWEFGELAGDRWRDEVCSHDRLCAPRRQF